MLSTITDINLFKDTVQYLFRELIKRGYIKIAYVSGSHSETDDGYKGSKFNEILEHFAPFTNLSKQAQKMLEQLQVTWDDIEKGEQKAINILSAGIKDWIKGQIPQKAVEEIQSLFKNGVNIKKTPEEKKAGRKIQTGKF